MCVGCAPSGILFVWGRDTMSMRLLQRALGDRYVTYTCFQECGFLTLLGELGAGYRALEPNEWRGKVGRSSVHWGEKQGEIGAKSKTVQSLSNLSLEEDYLTTSRFKKGGILAVEA